MNIKAFVALFAVVFGVQLGTGVVAPLMPIYADTMGASGLWLGIMFSGYALSRLMFMPVMGRLSDSTGRKRFMISGILAYAVVSLFYALASNIYELTFIRFLHGLASCAVIPIAQAYIGELTPNGKEGTYINLFSMSMFLGMGFGPLLAGTMTEYFYMNATFYAMSGLSTLALFLLLLLVPSTKAPSQLSGKSQRTPFLTIVRDNKVKGVFIFRASRAFWRQGTVAFLPILVASTMHMSEADIGLLLSAYLVTGGVAQGFVGPLADRCNKLVLLIICSIASPGLLFLIPFMHSGKILLAILIPTALIGAIARGTAMTLNVEMGKQYKAMGTIMGTFASASSLGMVAGPVVFGYVMDMIGVNWTFELGAAVGVIGGFITAYYFLHR